MIRIIIFLSGVLLSLTSHAAVMHGEFHGTIFSNSIFGLSEGDVF
jgi:hypothetical protein